MEVPTKFRQNCSFCGYTCTQLLHLEAHMRKHTREKPFTCDKCNRVFSTRTHLNTHVKNLHHPRPPKVDTETFKCSLCPYEEHSKLNYERHVLNHTGERRFPCAQPSCEYAAKTFEELKRHNISKHQSERKFKCPFPNCGYRGKSKRYVRSHYKSHNEHKPFACDFEGCTFQARTKFALKAHKLRVHHDGYRYKPFVCSKCEFSTTSMSQLKSHGVKHRDDRPFKCDFNGCAYAAKSKTSLNMHIVHRHTAKTFKCEFPACSFIGPSERMLQAHKKNVHSKKIYKCPCCNYRGAFLFRLQRHMKCHNHSQTKLLCQNKNCAIHGEKHDSLKHNNKRFDEVNITGRSFHCPLCPRQFSKDAYVLTHLQIHTVEKPFKCPVCNYEFAMKNTLITHVRSMHSDIFPEFCYGRKSTCNHCHMNFGCASGLAVHTINVKTPVVVLTRLQVKCDP